MSVLKIFVNKQSWIIKKDFYDILIEMYHNAKDKDYTEVILYFPKTILPEDVIYLNSKNVFDSVFLCCYVGDYYCISFSVEFINYLEKQIEQSTVP